MDCRLAKTCWGAKPMRPHVAMQPPSAQPIKLHPNRVAAPNACPMVVVTDGDPAALIMPAVMWVPARTPARVIAAPAPSAVVIWSAYAKAKEYLGICGAC